MRGAGRDLRYLAVAMLLVAAVVIAVSAVAHWAGFDLRKDVVPVLTPAGVAVAIAVFFMRERAEARRKTLEAFERLIYERDLRAAYSVVVTALQLGTYQKDSEPGSPGSHRDLTSFLINYVETACAAVEAGLYDRALFREFFDDVAGVLVANFLVDVPGEPPLQTRKFLPERATLTNLAAVFPETFAKPPGRFGPTTPPPPGPP